MTVQCPNGHQSQASDYCDVCGTPLPSSSAAGTAAPTPPAASTLAGSEEPATRNCPNCDTATTAEALFCEECGYDFTTGVMPGPAVPAGSGSGSGSGQTTTTLLEPPHGVATAPGPGQVAPGSSPVPESTGWVAEVWVDPEWYALQDPDAVQPCPSVGEPQVLPMRQRSVLIGRVSQSRNIHPEIDCSTDPGVSRRHAQLTSDGTRWFVEDLQSANGTYLGHGGLPDAPVDVGLKHELAATDRIYLGGWTRIVIREAAPDEV